MKQRQLMKLLHLNFYGKHSLREYYALRFTDNILMMWTKYEKNKQFKECNNLETPVHPV